MVLKKTLLYSFKK